MCIGLDVHGNVNLSLKATLPGPGSNQTLKTWETSNSQKHQEIQPPSDGGSSSSVVIQSAAECGEVEKSSSEMKSEVEAHVDAKKLILGTEVTAKVLQIRAHGLVLDLGGGIRGMYRFELNKRN